MIAYIIYMSYSDKNAPEDFKELKEESVSENIEKLKIETTKSINKAKKDVKESLEKEIDKKIDKVIKKIN